MSGPGGPTKGIPLGDLETGQTTKGKGKPKPAKPETRTGARQIHWPPPMHVQSQPRSLYRNSETEGAAADPLLPPKPPLLRKPPPALPPPPPPPRFCQAHRPPLAGLQYLR